MSNVRTSRGRNVPWLKVARFHREIAARAEDSFFSFQVRNADDERWTSLTNFSPSGLAGPWEIHPDNIRSTRFRQAVNQGAQQSIFLGGPCYASWARAGTGWVPKWSPVLFIEVKMVQDGEFYQISPSQGRWSLSPTVVRNLERLESDTIEDADLLAEMLVETTAGNDLDSQGIGSQIIDEIINRIPDLQKPLRSQLREDELDELPTEWVLFAPPSSSSAYTRNLLADYDRLLEHLEKDNRVRGGLAALEGPVKIGASSKAPVLPLISLNQMQQTAVDRILGEDPITVVSGPPGCGKSQVVVSVLLNAWERGESVLFASNNNKAVDVVRERLEKYETDFPVAIRAGNRDKNNAVEVLRKVLNYASVGHEEGGATDLADKRQSLIRERDNLQEELDSNRPQRAREAMRAALESYEAYQHVKAKLADHRRAITQLWKEAGFGKLPVKKVETSISKTLAWIDKIDDYRRLQEEDRRRENELQQQIDSITQELNEVVGAVGLHSEVLDPAGRGIQAPAKTLIQEWELHMYEALDSDLDKDMEPYEWDEAFSRWDTSSEASEFQKSLSALAGEVQSKVACVCDQADAIAQQRTEQESILAKLKDAGLEPREVIELAVLDQWLHVYAGLITMTPSITDRLPWSQHAKQMRRLSQIEQEMRCYIPLPKWQSIGPLDTDGGRDRLAEAVDLLRQWKISENGRRQLEPAIAEMEQAHDDIRMRCEALGWSYPTSPFDLHTWRALAERATIDADVARRASIALAARDRQQSAIALFKDMANRWDKIGSNCPIKKAWSESSGSELTRALEQVRTRPSPASVSALREVVAHGQLSQIKDLWQDASKHCKVLTSLYEAMDAVPSAAARIDEWHGSQPADCIVDVKLTSHWPDQAELLRMVEQKQESVQRRHAIESDVIPDLKYTEQYELKRAQQLMADAVQLLPDAEQEAVTRLIENRGGSKQGQAWPVEKICEGFEAYGPDVIRAKLDSIQTQIEAVAFEEARSSWHGRLNEDDASMQAVDQLERKLRANNFRVFSKDYPIFRNALRLVPIWITTAQAAQSIPMEAELFDLVVIDEASQCTLTNVLPLLYRAKRVAIIGDSEQLPAIPSIRDVEENTLAAKYGIQPFLSYIGHSATNDVYNVATQALPRGRADAIALVDHFRSHPLIIGFSNRHIYHQRLALKTNPQEENALPIAPGVYMHDVRGHAARGERGNSWLNRPEAESVMDVVRDIMANPELSHYRLGVVTPFRPQKDLIRSMVDDAGLSANVLVDSAYGFQGDERDIMIFSPVVAPGITAAATRWVESPPNLVNVALTRARKVLYVVGDFSYCSQLDPSSVIRKLSDYCKSIELLRSVSPQELNLYGWMIVQGWTPEIHPRVGDVEVDFLLQSDSGRRIAIEVDGQEAHRGKSESDRLRDTALLTHGVKVFRVSGRDVEKTPHAVIERIAELVYG